jgi:hypothetical protein
MLLRIFERAYCVDRISFVDAEKPILEYGVIVGGILGQDIPHAGGAIVVPLLAAGDLHRKHPRRQVIGVSSGDLFQQGFRLCGRAGAKLESCVPQTRRRSQRAQIDRRLESLVRCLDIFAAPGEGRQRNVDERQIRLEPGGGFEFALGALVVLLPQRKRAQRQMIAGAVLIVLTQAHDKVSGLLQGRRCHRGGGQDRQRLGVSWLFFQGLEGVVVRLLEIPERKAAFSEIELRCRQAEARRLS